MTVLVLSGGRADSRGRCGGGGDDNHGKLFVGKVGGGWERVAHTGILVGGTVLDNMDGGVATSRGWSRDAGNAE